ncbi:semaphorin-7A [Pseudophryne corroboree]|uniref:semaphorin-7A n=1 Tax=Pseudophryne corroboree TaxID=495146 RepID=UPI00308210E6
MEIHIPIFLSLCASLCLGNGYMRMTPRIIHPNSSIWSAPLPKEEKNAVFYLSPLFLYIGGKEAVYRLNRTDFRSKSNYTIAAEMYNCKERPYCKNYVTFVGQLIGDLTVCGTNAYNPRCWRMDGETFQTIDMTWTEQLAPRTPETNYNILISGQQTYSTLPRKSNNAASLLKSIFRKINGTYPLLFTGDNLMRAPHFVKSLVVEKENQVQDKILLFYIEDNNVTRTTEKRVSMVAQMCKGETGSVKPSIRNVFSSALKSRLICGNELAGQYFPYLKDVFFLQGKTGSAIYGLFTNAWNHSAVCSYNIEDIEFVFNTSSFLGSSKKDLKIRPGTCLPSPELTPEDTSDEASNFPELTDSVKPSGKKEVFQTLTHYIKIVVDEITAANEEHYRVLLLATESGTVHKVIEHNDGALNVLELRPFSQEEQILHLELEPREHALYVGTGREVSRVPLDDCTAYNNSCTDCIQSRDPYCGWNNMECQSILRTKRSLQNLTQGAMCNNGQETHPQPLKRTALAHSTDVPAPRMYFMSCPAVSNHATYSWKNGDTEMGPCIRHNGVCYMFFKQVTYPGKYQCLAEEVATQHVILEYNMKVPNNAMRIQYNWFVGLTMLRLVFM